MIAASQAVYDKGPPRANDGVRISAAAWLEEARSRRWLGLRRYTRLFARRANARRWRACATIATRKEMLQYPEFRAAGYEIGLGPTEAFCKTLTARLKGQGMRWDKPNAEAMMALAGAFQRPVANLLGHATQNPSLTPTKSSRTRYFS